MAADRVRLMKGVGRYYASNLAHAAQLDSTFPEALGERQYYHLVERGLEIKIRDKLERLKQLDRQANREGE